MVYYIYHSAFVVELEKSILIFDFYKFPNNKINKKKEFFNRFIKRTDKKFMYLQLIVILTILIKRF